MPPPSSGLMRVGLIRTETNQKRELNHVLSPCQLNTYLGINKRGNVKLNSVGVNIVAVENKEIYILSVCL